MKTINLRLMNFFEVFLKEYSNLKTQQNVRSTLQIIENIDTIDIHKLSIKSKEIINNLTVCNYTKNFHIINLKAFLKWLSILTKQHYNSKIIPLYPRDLNRRQPYSDQEMSLLENELKAFNHQGFTLAWKLICFNGVRINEFVNINWRSLKSNNYQTQIHTNKNGNNRLFIIPKHLIIDFDNLGMDLSYNYLQNLFTRFRKFVYDRNPNFRKPIHAHMLRHCFITKIAINLGSIEKVQTLTGHVNPSVLIGTYIKFNNLYQKIWLEQANGETIEALDKQKMFEYIKICNQQIAHLKQILIDHKIDYENSPVIELLN